MNKKHNDNHHESIMNAYYSFIRRVLKNGLLPHLSILLGACVIIVFPILRQYNIVIYGSEYNYVWCTGIILIVIGVICYVINSRFQRELARMALKQTESYINLLLSHYIKNTGYFGEEELEKTVRQLHLLFGIKDDEPLSSVTNKHKEELEKIIKQLHSVLDIKNEGSIDLEEHKE